MLVVLDLLRCSNGSARLCLFALRAIRWLAGGVPATAKCAPNISAFFAASGLEVVLSAMRTFAADASVCEWACAAWSALACLDDEAKVCIVSSGGLDHIYAAMAAHVGVSDVQDKACWALANLSANTDNRVRIMSSGGLDHIYAAMAAHVRVSEVQLNACRVLMNLASNVGHATRIVSSGGLGHIFAAMAAHVSVSEVQRYACWALAILAADADNKVRIVSSGGLDHIYAAMTAHLEVSEVQHYACAVLMKLSVDHGNQDRIVLSDGLDHIFAAMAAHVRVPEVQWRGVACLNNLSASPFNLPLVKAGGRAAAALRVALAAHPTHADINKWAPKLLKKLNPSCCVIA